MKRRKVFRIVGWGFLVAFFGIAGFVAWKWISLETPGEAVTLAREAIAQAKSSGAETYAADKLAKAEQLFNEAMLEWKIQNEKFFAFRDYKKTVELANASLKQSTGARFRAGTEKNNAKQRLEQELDKAEKQIVHFEKKLKVLPLGKEIYDNYNRGKLYFLEAKENFEKGEYQKGLVQSTAAREIMTRTENAARLRLNRFFESYPDWKKNETLAWQLSKKGSNVVLVNKMDASVTVLKSGKKVRVFEAEFGPNWMGDKIMKGDKSTPEGIYRVTEKKKGAKTKYHKALLLNYPNDDDKARFESLKKAGIISGNTQIGGLIEIHGDGGKGIHWTDGCIALNNKDMDVLYELCAVSTPVIIIGADKTLEEYLNLE